jgi:AcrR family transcriptional regulator
MPRKFTLKPKKIPTQERARVTFDSIVKAAARVLEKRGYAALTTNHVARQAGIGIASLYEYFPNKESIVAAVIEEAAASVVSELEEALLLLIGRHPPDVAIRNWIGVMFETVEKRRVLLTVLLGEVPFLHQVPAMVELRNKLLQLSARGEALGGMLATEHREALTYLLPIMVSNAVTEAILRPPPHLSRQALESALSDFVIRALGPS